MTRWSENGVLVFSPCSLSSQLKWNFIATIAIKSTAKIPIPPMRTGGEFGSGSSYRGPPGGRPACLNDSCDPCSLILSALFCVLLSILDGSYGEGLRGPLLHLHQEQEPPDPADADRSQNIGG